MSFPARPLVSAAPFRAHLLTWYGHSRRDLPWRRTQDPYAIWISEVMLQQTRVAVVEQRFVEFLTRFPSVMSLALAEEDEVLALWSGLGYYRRARMLHKAAQFVAANLGGTLPRKADDLRALPGIGAYTAAAIASIAHDEPVAVVDGNVERVLCRVAGWGVTARTPQGMLRRQVELLAQQLVDPRRPGDFNQAMMELGATVCVPRNPACMECPVARFCKTRGEHKTAPRAAMQSREVAYALAVRAERREVLLQRRGAEHTVMPGMWELPPLREAAVPEQELRMTVRHSIMQVNYYVRVRSVFEEDVERLAEDAAGRRWVSLREAGALPLTGLARKVLTRARLLERAGRAVPAGS